MAFEAWVVAGLRALQRYVPAAWRTFLKHLVRCGFGWLAVLPEFLRYCHSQVWCLLRAVPRAQGLTVVIVEPHLGARSVIGHELPFALTLATCLREQGITVHVLGHRRPNPAVFAAFERGEIPCHRVFGQSGVGSVPITDADSGVSALGRFIAHAFASATDLTWGLRRSRAAMPRVLFFPSSGLSRMVGTSLLRWGGSRNSFDESQIHVFHHPNHLGREGSYLSDLRRWLRAFFSIGLHVGTVNPRINSHLRAVGEAEAVQIPIPRPMDIQRRASPPGSPRRIGFLGRPRPEKGSLRLPTLLPRLLERHESLRIVVQASVATGEPEIRQAMDQLRQLATRSARIELIEQPLDMDQYYALLNGIDVVVLPYEPGSYYADSISAVGIEAMALGRVVVGPDFGWFGEQRDAYRGYLAVDTGDTEQLAGRILEAVADFDRLSQQAERDAPKFDWHNVQSLVRLLMETAERDGLESRRASPSAAVASL